MLTKVREPTTLGAVLYEYWRPYIEFYHEHSMKFHQIMLLKSVVIMLLNSRHLQQLQWLDCWLPGRIHYGTRITQFSRYLAVFSWFLFLCNKLLLDRVGIAFNLFCLQVACFNFEHTKSVFTWSPVWPKSAASRAHLDEGGNSERHPALCEYFLSPLDWRQLIQRPTQTNQMHNLFAKLHLFAIIVLAFSFTGLLLVSIVMHGPLMLTRRGFELSRENCVHFIVRQATSIQTGSSNHFMSGYKFIYEPDSRNLSAIYRNRVNPLVLPYDELVPLNLYHIIQIIADIAENLLIWPGMLILYWYNIYHSGFFSLEIIAYAKHLHRRLNDLVHKLSVSNEHVGDELSEVIASSSEDTFVASPSHGSKFRPSSAQLGLGEMERLQASLFDYFWLVSFYNPFFGLTTLANLILWLFYSFFIFARGVKLDRFLTVSTLDQGVQTEFFVIFAVCMLIALIFLVSGARVHSESSKLYLPIARVVALDRSLLHTRKRWLAILDHFEPNKLHCFTILGHITLSWLFILKVRTLVFERVLNLI